MAKFKKLAIVSSAVLMTTAFAFGVAACGEEACAHTYEKKSNETHTWYACTQEGCDSVVGKEEIHVHNYVKKNDETHTWYACDKEGCDSVVAKEEIVTPHVHTFALKSNDTKHWYECTDTACGVKVGEMNHVWNDGEETLAPEVGVDGEYTYTCRVCGKTDTESVPALLANPLIVAEGKVTVQDGGDYVEFTKTLEAGDYVIIPTGMDTQMKAVKDEFEDYTKFSYYGGSLQFSVETAGAVDIAIGYDSWSYSMEEVEVEYVIKKVPSVTLDFAVEEAQEDIVTFAWTKVSFVVPTAGKYAVAVENAVVSSETNGGEQFYVFNTTEENETVSFYVKADDNGEEYATAYIFWAALEATELVEGANVLPLWGFTATDVTFTVPATGAYKIATYDDSLAFYKVYDDATWDYQLFEKVNGISYFEAEEGDVISFFVTGLYEIATFAIEEFPDEERYTSVVTFDQMTGEGYANLKAGSTATLQLPMAMMRNFGMVTWDNADVTLSIDNNGSALTATTQKVAFNAPYGATVSVTNTAEEDIELTFTLALLNGMDGVVDGSVEVYVPASGGSPMSTVSLPVQLSAGTYTASVSSSTITSASYNATTLSTTEVEITASGDIDTLSLLGANETAEMVVVTIVAPAIPGTMESPIEVAAAGQAFVDVALVDVTVTTPWGEATQKGLCFSYTATADGVVSVSGVFAIEPMNGFEPIDQSSFDVVAGQTYIVFIGQQDMMGNPISPEFTFTAAE